MKQLMIMALLTCAPSALRAETAADMQDLGAARESSSVQFDRLAAKDAGPAVVAADNSVLTGNKKESALALTESKKKPLPSAVPAISEKKKESGLTKMMKDERADAGDFVFTMAVIAAFIGGLAYLVNALIVGHL